MTSQNENSSFVDRTTRLLADEVITMSTRHHAWRTRNEITTVVKRHMNQSFGWPELVRVLEGSRFNVYEVWHGRMAYPEWMSSAQPADDFFPRSQAVRPAAFARRLVKDLLCAEVLRELTHRHASVRRQTTTVPQLPG